MTVKGTLKYRKVERTPQVGKDAGKKCRIELLDNRVTVEDETAYGGDDNGGSSSSGTEEPGNEFD